MSASKEKHPKVLSDYLQLRVCLKTVTTVAMWISVNAMMNCCSSDGVPLVSAVRPLQQLRAVSGRKSRSSHFRRRALEERLPVDSAGDLIEPGSRMGLV